MDGAHDSVAEIGLACGIQLSVWGEEVLIDHDDPNIQAMHCAYIHGGALGIEAESAMLERAKMMSERKEFARRRYIL